MKLKCSKCNKIVNKRKDVFNDNVKILGIDPEDYKTFYLCRACRQYQYFDWNEISSHPKLLQYPNLIEKYKGKLSWWKVCRYQKLTEEFIEKYKDYVDWAEVCRHQKLSEPFIEKHIDKVKWSPVFFVQTLSIEFIEKHIDKINDKGLWSSISAHRELPEWFIEKYEDKVDWAYISQYQKLSPEFITKHIDKIEGTILYNEPVMKTLPDTIKLLLTQKFGL